VLSTLKFFVNEIDHTRCFNIHLCLLDQFRNAYAGKHSLLGKQKQHKHTRRRAERNSSETTPRIQEEPNGEQY